MNENKEEQNCLTHLIITLYQPMLAQISMADAFRAVHPPGGRSTRATPLPFACPICLGGAFRQRWQEVLAPLELDPQVSIRPEGHRRQLAMGIVSETF